MVPTQSVSRMHAQSFDLAQAPGSYHLGSPCVPVAATTLSISRRILGSTCLPSMSLTASHPLRHCLGMKLPSLWAAKPLLAVCMFMQDAALSERPGQQCYLAQCLHGNLDISFMPQVVVHAIDLPVCLPRLLSSWSQQAWLVAAIWLGA